MILAFLNSGWRAYGYTAFLVMTSTLRRLSIRLLAYSIYCICLLFNLTEKQCRSGALALILL